jgi:hypothetical protein
MRYQDEWCCVVCQSNAAVGEELTAAHLRSLPWATSYSGPTASTPAARQMRRKRRTARSPNLHPPTLVTYN